MNNDTRIFTGPQLHSVLTGKLKCPIDELAELLSFVTGEELVSPSFGRATDFARRVILSQHPDLVIVDEEFELFGEFFITARPELWDRKTFETDVRGAIARVDAKLAEELEIRHLTI